MKKDKQENKAKTEKPKAWKPIQQRLITDLSAVLEHFGQKAEKAGIDIEKESKKLAKKIGKGLKALKDTVKEKTLGTEKSASPEIKVVMAKPAAKSEQAAAKKPISTTQKPTALPAKTVAAKPDVKPVSAVKAKTPAKTVASPPSKPVDSKTKKDKATA